MIRTFPLIKNITDIKYDTRNFKGIYKVDLIKVWYVSKRKLSLTEYMDGQMIDPNDIRNDEKLLL